jgi:glutathione synthase/RimK-type ligase-like ATP-grasp enzyme
MRGDHRDGVGEPIRGERACKNCKGANGSHPRPAPSPPVSFPPLRIVFAISRAASVDETWTTVHFAREALARGDRVRFVEPWDFEVGPDHRLIARAHALDEPTTADRIAQQLARRRAPRRYVDLSVLTFAALARDRGVRVVNDPEGLMRVSHKGWLASLPGVRTPATVVTRSRASCHEFHQAQPDGVVVKPARGSGGRSVGRVAVGDAEALDAAFDAARVGSGSAQREPQSPFRESRLRDPRASIDGGDVVVQQYLPEAEAGEKRLVWLDGVVIGGYLRRRAAGEFRHNLKRGAVPEPTTIGAEERVLGSQIAPHLLRAGVRLAGLDVIGGYLIEVNALNPGGAFHVDRLTGSRLGATIIDRLTQPPLQEPLPWAVPAP